MPHCYPINRHFYSCYIIDYLFVAGVDRFATKFISYGVPNPCNLYNMLTISTLYSLSLSFQTSAVYCTAFIFHQGPPTRTTRWDGSAFVEVEDDPNLGKRYRGFVFLYVYSLRGLDCCFCPN